MVVSKLPRLACTEVTILFQIQVDESVHQHGLHPPKLYYNSSVLEQEIQIYQLK